MKNSALVVGGIIFSLVALLHLIRLIYQWKIIIAGYVVPISFSVIGFVITIILALWMFASTMKN